MNSLYVHIPFCLKKCDYCDFVSFGKCGEDIKNSYVNAIIEEINNLPWIEPCTVFVGGGTPTAIKPDLLAEIMDAIHKRGIADNCEITVEANPETIDIEYAQALKSMGVNRISMGLQTSKDRLLKNIGRVHTYDKFLKSYDLLRKSGFDNINVDLMYGLPGQEKQDFESTLKEILSLEPEHISAYSLILSEGTPMYERAINKEIDVPEGVDMEDALGMLEDKYHRYEVSNYAKEGRECRHNINYWNNGYYFGVGCGAHGCVSPITAKKMGFDCDECVAVRTEHGADLSKYIAGEKPTFETIGKLESMFETVMLGLRMVKGVEEKAFQLRYGIELNDIIYEYINGHGDLITREDGFIRLTKRGMDIQNTVLVDLMEYFEK